MLISKQLKTLPLGSFANVDQARQLSRNSDNEIEMAEAIRAYASLTGGSMPKSVADLYEKFGGARYPIKVLPSPESRYGLGIDGGMNSKGGFDVPGLGRGHCFTRHQFNYVDPTAPFHMIVAFRLDDFPASTLENGVISAAVHFAPKDFPLIPGENLAGVACIPLDVLLEPERRYDHGTGGGYEREVKALVCAVERTDLARVAGNTGGVSFYATLKLEDGRTFYINRDGIPGRNFLLPSDEEFKGLGVA
jgi:hypothetical protein